MGSKRRSRPKDSTGPFLEFRGRVRAERQALGSTQPHQIYRPASRRALGGAGRYPTFGAGVYTHTTMFTLEDIASLIEPVQRRYLSALRIEGSTLRCEFAPGAPDGRYGMDHTWVLAQSPDVPTQAEYLAASGYVGAVDSARYDYADRPTVWILKTHAGSDAERAEWLLSLART